MTTLNINFNKIILAILIIVFFAGVTVVRFFEDAKRLADSANAPGLNDKVTESSSTSPLLTFGVTYRTGLSTKNNLFKIPLLLDVFDEDFGYTTESTDDQLEHEDRELSEGELLSISEGSNGEKWDSKKVSDLNQDEKNKHSLIFKKRLTAVLNDSQFEFEERLEKYKRDKPTDEDEFVTIVDSDDIAESDFYYYAEEDIPLIEEDISVPY